jgi:hypothetical protein
LHTGPASLHLVLRVQKDGGMLESVEQRAKLPIRKLDVQGRTIGLDVGVASFEGTLTYPKSRGPFPAAFVVLMAGSGASGDRVLLQQDFDSARASGVPEAKIKQDLDMEAKLYEVVPREKDTAATEKRMRELLGSAPGAVGEYARIEETIAPAAQDAIGNWLSRNILRN